MKWLIAAVAFGFAVQPSLAMQDAPRPKPVKLRVVSGCNIRVDGKHVDMAGFEAMVPTWVAARRDLDMQIDAAAGTNCMNAVIGVLWPYKEHFPRTFNAEGGSQ